MTTAAVALGIAIIFVVAFYRFPDEWKAIFRAFASLLQKTKKFGLTGIEVQENPPPPTPDERRPVDEFFRTFDNPLVHEQENAILADLRTQHLEAPQDRERALLKALAIWQVLFHFEKVHGSIWGSQTHLLRHINERPAGVPLAEVRPFYDAAAATFPPLCTNYTFENWLIGSVNLRILTFHELRAILSMLCDVGKKSVAIADCG